MKKMAASLKETQSVDPTAQIRVQLQEKKNILKRKKISNVKRSQKDVEGCELYCGRTPKIVTPDWLLG